MRCDLKVQLYHSKYQTIHYAMSIVGVKRNIALYHPIIHLLTRTADKKKVVRESKSQL